MSKKAVRIDCNGNSICTRCGAADFFTVTEDSNPNNPANKESGAHPNGFCPYCGAEFAHVVEVADLNDYKEWCK